MSHPLSFRTYILTLLVLSFSGSWATDYYVSPAGKDTNSGAQSSPWQTITKVNAINFSAGDRIFFQGSQTFNGKLYFDSNDKGTPSSPITISSYGTGRATINGGTSDSFFAYNTAGLTISNINFAGSGGSCTGTGLNFYNDLAGSVKLGHIYIDSVDVSNLKGGITIGGWNGVSGYNDLRITNTSVHDNWSGNITTYGQTDYAITNVYIGHCQTFNSSGDPNQTSSSSGNGIVLGSVNGGLIERCLSYNNGWLCNAAAGPAGIWCYTSNAVTIQYCEAWRNQGVNADGDGFDFDGDTSNSIMQYNYSHDNDGAGLLVCEYSGAPNPNSNNIVRYNVSQDDCRKRAYGSIDFYNAGPGLQNCEVYNNTIFLSPPAYGSVAAVNLYSPTTNVHIRNNILVTTGGMPLVNINAAQSGLVFDHNCYWSSGAAFSITDNVAYSSLSSWRSATGNEASVGINVDPMLTAPGTAGTIGNADNLVSLSAYKLQNGSPMIDAGLNWSALGINPGTQDFYGSSIAQGSSFDIGAHEFPGGSVAKTYALTVNSGSGSGAYAAGSVVTIIANTPAPGLAFSQWIGATVGNSSSATTTLTMPSANTAVTATYTASSSTPYTGTPFAIPGTVAVAQYDNGGEGIAYHDVDTVNQASSTYRPGEGVDADVGYVAWIQASEWLKYTVKVGTAGTYIMSIPVACPATGGALHVEFNGVNVTGTINVPNTGGWNAGQTLTATVNLSAGVQIMRVVFDTNSTTGYVCNLTDISITAKTVTDTPPTITSQASATPNPATVRSAITFSVGASDADGDALTYSWNFGDASSGTGASLSHIYAAAGTYTAGVTVDDGRGGTVNSSVSVIVKTPVISSTAHVGTIAMSVVKSGNAKSANATITIVDGNGAPVSGATVSGNWSGLTSGSASGTTSSAGTVTFTSARTRSTGSFTFSITGVAAAGYTYASSQNSASSGTITTSGQVTTATIAAATTAAAPLASAIGDLTDTGAISLGSLAGNQPFKLALPLPTSLLDAKGIRASAKGLPLGLRVSGVSIGGRPQAAGTVTITVSFQGKLISVDANGKPEAGVIMTTQTYTFTVN
jgi:hypothetical protein